MAFTHRNSRVRTHDAARRDIPAAGRYVIDPQHTAVEFISRHMMINKVRGRLPDVAGVITISDEPESSHVEVDIEVAGINTGIPERDRHLRSADFFDVDRYPRMMFRSTSVRDNGRVWVVVGDLTIRGVTQEVELAVTFDGVREDAPEEFRISFNATTQVDREDWGLTWNKAIEAGGVLVSKMVEIEIHVQATSVG